LKSEYSDYHVSLGSNVDMRIAGEISDRTSRQDMWPEHVPTWREKFGPRGSLRMRKIIYVMDRSIEMPYCSSLECVQKRDRGSREDGRDSNPLI